MKRILESCTILLLGLVATQTIASAEDTNDLEGLWFTKITVTDCHNVLLRNVQNFEMFLHDGSSIGPGGTVPPSPQALGRTDSVGMWRHLQAHTYAATFWFFGLNPDGTLASKVMAVRTIQVNGDQFTGSDHVTVFDLSDHVLSTACTTVSASRLRAP